MKAISKLFILLMLAVPFVGCSNDDKNSSDVSSIEGTYTGQLSLFNVIPAGKNNVPVTLAVKSEDKVTFAIDATFDASMGTEAVMVTVTGSSDHPVNYEDSGYLLGLATGAYNVKVVTAEGTTNIPNASVSIEGTVFGSDIELIITVPLPASLLQSMKDSAPAQYQAMMTAIMAELPSPDQYGNIAVPVSYKGKK